MDAKSKAPEQAPSRTIARDRPFDGWRVPATANAWALVSEAIRRAENYENHCKPRKRARKERDQRIFEATVTAIISDLSVHALSGFTGAVAITRSGQQLARRSRYRPPALNDRLPHVLDILASPELGLVEMTKGWHDLDPQPHRERYRQTTIIAGPVLLGWIERDKLCAADFGRDQAEEIILLKGFKPKRGEVAPPHVEPQAPLIEYDDGSPDNPSHRMRADMRRINAGLEAADIAIDQGGPEALRQYDTTQRRLRRHFTQNDFESGGRLFGGFWQPMRREHRPWLRIGGEPTVTLDYQAMFVNLAYARMGVQPKGDPYIIPGLETYRSGIKRVMAAMLFSYRPTGNVPQGTRKLLPRGVPLEEIVGAIMEQHRPIRGFLCFEFGHRLMFDESEIMVAALLRLSDLQITGLPLHDALCVPAWAKEQVRQVMITAYRDRMGQKIEVGE